MEIIRLELVKAWLCSTIKFDTHDFEDGLDFLTWFVGIHLDMKLVVFLTKSP